MRSATAAPSDIGAYIAGFPEEVQKKLQQIRAIVSKTAPQAVELSATACRHSCCMATWYCLRDIKTISASIRFPRTTGILSGDLSPYKTGSGSVQFPLNKPLPVKLIAKLVKFNMKRLEEKAALKQMLKH